MTTRTRARAAWLPGLLVALALVWFLAGCGSEDDARPSAATDTGSTDGEQSSEPPTTSTTSTSTTPGTPGAPTIPAGTPGCDQVWKSGARLPPAYRGCVADNVLVRPDRLRCESGQAIVRFADRYYAVAGGTISEVEGQLLDDPGYTETVLGCRA